MDQKIEELRQLAYDKNIRDPRKLYQYAKIQEIRDVTQAMASKALESQVARQVLAPPPRYQGHFASSRPGQDIQADLIDFSKNTSAKIPHRYAVVLADVFTRKLDIETVKTKDASTVEAAMRRGLKDLGVDGSKAALIRTDQGKEFSTINDVAPHIHVQRDVRDRNGLAIVDRGIQSIKRDLAAEVGKKKGTRWSDVAEKVVEDHNEKPNAAVFGAPGTVATNPVQQFKVLQRNAENYEVDIKNSRRQTEAIQKAGYFREPIDNGGRSFRPAYGPAQKVERVDSDYVYAKGHLAAIQRGETGDDYSTLLKQARPATPGQLATKLVLDTDKIQTKQSAKTVLRNQALALENLLMKQGSASAADIQKLPGMKRLTRKYKNLTETNWISKAYKDKFVVQDGTVRLKNQPSSSSSAPAPAPPAPAPAPKPKLTPAERFKALQQIYGRKPVT